MGYISGPLWSHIVREEVESEKLSMLIKKKTCKSYKKNPARYENKNATRLNEKFSFLDNVSKADLGGESVAVEDNRIAVLAIPAVKLNAATT